MTFGKVGFYGGKFAPIHQGHVYAMIKASTMVDELHIIVSYDDEFERDVLFKDTKMKHVPFNIRLRWWKQITRDMSHVHVHAIEEKQTGQFSDWEKGAEGIKEAIGKHIDVVFSSEHEYGEFFSKLYPTAKHIVIDAKRETYNISATKLRKDGAMEHWDMLPEIVKPYFAKRVVIVGTESCGKSTMVKNLANLYNTTFVEEYGRTFYERLGGCDDITIPSDYPEIAFGHKYREMIQLQKANKVLIIDTEAIVTQYYSMLYLNQRNPILDAIAREQQYDLWLFLEPDVKWVDDGTRVHGEHKIREQNNMYLKELLRQFGIKYVTVSGNYHERLDVAVKYINDLIECRGE
jgi:HTH-type transcriptional repressor of NAD biosynthesis genes